MGSVTKNIGRKPKFYILVGWQSANDGLPDVRPKYDFERSFLSVMCEDRISTGGQTVGKGAQVLLGPSGLITY